LTAIEIDRFVRESAANANGSEPRVLRESGHRAPDYSRRAGISDMGMIRRRLLKLEQEAKAKGFAISQEIQYAVFGAMKIRDDDWKLLDAIADRGEHLQTRTPQEEAALERFSAEFERAYKLLSSGNYGA
jgi:hypothetical protein